MLKAWATQCFLSQLSHKSEFRDSSSQQSVPTFCDNAFQVDDIGVIELPHNTCFSQEISSLLLCIAHLQGFDSHWEFTFSLQFQPPAADFSKFTFRKKKKKGIRACQKNAWNMPVYRIQPIFYRKLIKNTQACPTFMNMESRTSQWSSSQIASKPQAK